MAESRLDSSGALTAFYAEQAAIKDFYCPSCDVPVGLEDGWLIVTNRRVACACGASYDIFDVKVKLTPSNDSWKFLTEAPVRATSWFHATHDAKWERLFSRKTPVDVHLGTENAAFDRALGVYISRYAHVKSSFELYEVRLKPTAEIASRILQDTNSQHVRVRGSDVTRYINRWEDPSSISLVARTHALEIVGKRTVHSDEALERISIYNVRPKAS